MKYPNLKKPETGEIPKTGESKDETENFVLNESDTFGKLPPDIEEERQKLLKII